MVSSGYSGNGMSTGVTTIRENYLGARETCLRSIRGVFVSTFDVCDIILKHFAKKNIKNYKKFEKLDFSEKKWDFLKILKNTSIFFNMKSHWKSKKMKFWIFENFRNFWFPIGFHIEKKSKYFSRFSKNLKIFG